MGTSIPLALTNRAPVAKGAREGTSLAGVESDTEKKFGPLKVVLEAIPALYANHEVRLRLRSSFPFDEYIRRNPLL